MKNWGGPAFSSTGGWMSNFPGGTFAPPGTYGGWSQANDWMSPADNRPLNTYRGPSFGVQDQSDLWMSQRDMANNWFGQQMYQYDQGMMDWDLHR
jgi:hypothetical protein